MSLILAPVSKTWQAIDVKAPGKKGFIKQTFDAQFLVPTMAEFEEAVKEKTVAEVLGLYLVNAKRIQATEDDAKEVEFTPEVKEALISTPWIRGSLWESLQNVISGGRLKN